MIQNFGKLKTIPENFPEIKKFTSRQSLHRTPKNIFRNFNSVKIYFVNRDVRSSEERGKCQNIIFAQVIVGDR
jgi:hypothetical protein